VRDLPAIMISVLFVDDEPVLVDIGRLFLERAGEFSVTGVLSGKEAVSLLKENSYDVIISDYQMPGMNGLELLRLVRKHCGDVPFILFTGRGDEAVAGDAVNIGADFYVQKGGDPKQQFSDIARKIETAVERRRAFQAVRASEQRFHDIINFLPDATFAISTEGIIIAWNREIERITKTRAEDMIGRGAYAHSVPFYGSRRPMIIDLLLSPDPEFERSYPSVHREDDIITADGVLQVAGKKRYFLARASLLYDQDGKKAGAIESLRDITLQKESEEKLSRVIERLPIGLQIFRFEIDGSLVCHSANPAAEEITGISGRCVPGRPIEEVFHDDESQKVCTICRKIAMEGGRDCMDDVNLLVNGSPRRYNIRMFQTGPGEVALLYV